MDQEVKSPRTPRFEEYLAGAFFGYTLSILPIYIITYLFQVYSIDPSSLDPISLYLLFITPFFFGGAIAGYLVVRRSEIDHWKVGIKAGIGCLILMGLLMGLVEGRPANPLALATVFLGCTFSGYLYGRKYQKKIKTQNK